MPQTGWRQSSNFKTLHHNEWMDIVWTAQCVRSSDIILWGCCNICPYASPPSSTFTDVSLTFITLVYVDCSVYRKLRPAFFFYAVDLGIKPNVLFYPWICLCAVESGSFLKWNSPLQLDSGNIKRESQATKHWSPTMMLNLDWNGAVTSEANDINRLQG